jgi:predicted dinucleotide-binding enzyme
MVDPALTNASAVVFGGGAGWGKRVHDVLMHMVRDVRVLEKESTPAEIDKAVRASQLVFFAIPDNLVDGALSALENRLGGKIVIDCASNKSGLRTLKQVAQSARAYARLIRWSCDQFAARPQRAADARR